MQIKSTLTTKSGQILNTEYNEGVDPTQNLDGKILQGVHAYCFYKDKLVVVYAGKKGTWGPPGGHIEDGETYEEAVTREVMQESNMKVLHQELIGFIDAYEPNKTIRQTRSFCVVEPYGDFEADTDIEGDITEMKLIDPKDYKKYFDWGEVGDRIMQRAMEMLKKIQ
jgi:ADP-ribose pyrophosphatase YjhB (NUDIX family)